MFTASWRAHPGAGRKAVMRALGVSARAVRRAEAEVDGRGFVLGRSRWRWAGGLLAGVGIVGGLALLHQGLPGDHDDLRSLGFAQEEGDARTAARRAEERAIYAALDRSDAGHTGEAVAQLASEDEALRLAALRYLVKLVASEAAVDVAPAALIALLDDPSSRVRRAAVQLLGGLEEAPFRDATVRVALARRAPARARRARRAAGAGPSGVAAGPRAGAPAPAHGRRDRLAGSSGFAARATHTADRGPGARAREAAGGVVGRAGSGGLKGASD